MRQPLLLFLPLSLPAAPDFELVSVEPGGSAGDRGSYSAVASADGRIVVFESRATDLVPGDTNGKDDVYARDLDTGVTTRVSVPSGGGNPDDHCRAPSVSADGRFVVFESSATNLVPGDTNGRSDVFLRDLELGTTTRVSVQHDGSQTDGHSDMAAISGDGTLVVFTTNSSGMTPVDIGATVIARDLWSGTNEAVDVALGGGGPSHEGRNAFASEDGRYVVWESTASNLVPGDTSTSDVFLRDRQLGTTEKISVSSAGIGGNSYAQDAEVSADGRYVVYMSFANNLVANDTNASEDVFLRDRVAGTTTRLSVDAAGVEGDLYSRSPAMSSDGRFVAFVSRSMNLVAGDTSFVDDVFVRDLVLDTIELVSIDQNGQQLDKHSLAPDLADDGTAVVWDSKAAPVAGDTNGDSDVFRRELPGIPPADYRVLIRLAASESPQMSGNLGFISPGDHATIVFELRESNVYDIPPGTARGYEIDVDSWSMAFDFATFTLAAPQPNPPLFSIRNDVFSKDTFAFGFAPLATAPIEIVNPGGLEPPYEIFFEADGAASLLPSIDIADAVGTYTTNELFGTIQFIENSNPPDVSHLHFLRIEIQEIADGSVTTFGCGVNPPGSLSLLSGIPNVGETITFGVDNPLGTQAAGSSPLVMANLVPAVGFPCGVALPGFGMAGPGAIGELLLSLTPPNPLFVGAPWAGAGIPAPVPVPVPPGFGLVGVDVYFQGLIVDPVAAQGVPVGLTDGIVATIGG